jgi:hypothetical protein
VTALKEAKKNCFNVEDKSPKICLDKAQDMLASVWINQANFEEEISILLQSLNSYPELLK